MTEPIFISSFTHKGGVGKTTGLHNMACVLSKEFRFRVLLIDCDPQCSLTSVILHNFFFKIGEKHLKRNKDEYTEAEIKQIGEEIFYEKDIDEPARELNLRSGQNEVPNVKKRRTVYECFRCEDMTQFATEDNIKNAAREVELIPLKEYGQLFVLPGDLLLNTLEKTVAGGFSFGKIEELRSHQKIPGTICQLFREVGKIHRVDLILIDLSPAATFFNQSVVMCSDYFIISNLADYYSRRSITSIADVLKSWDKAVEFLRSSEILSSYFKFPACPKFLGHVFHRVKVKKGKPTFNKLEKIELIQEEIRKKLVEGKLQGGKKTVVENFELYNPPIIKEFERFYDKAVEKGVPMAYITSENIKLKDEEIEAKFNKKKKKDTTGKQIIKDAQKYHLNAYFTAIALIFSNLSEEHHLRLGNLFKPKNQPQEEFDDLSDQEMHGKYQENPLIFQAKSNPGKALFYNPEISIPESLTKLVNKVDEKITNLFFEDMLEAYLPDGKMNSKIEDQAFKKLCFKEEEKASAKANMIKQLKDKELIESDKNLSEMDDLKLLSEVHLFKEKKAQKFVESCLLEKKNTAEVHTHLRSKEAKKCYIDNLKKRNIKIGIKSLKLCAIERKKNLRIWQPDSLPFIKFKEEQVEDKNVSEFIDLLEADKKNIYWLVPKARPIKNKDSSNKNEVNGKRQNPNGQNGPQTEKKKKV